MDLLHLQYFLEVYKHMNISKAAEELYISQPSLSKTLSVLEKNLGYPLFDRQGKKLIINPYGELFYDYAQHVLKLTEELKKSMEKVSGEMVSSLYISSVNYLFVDFWLNEFLSSYKEIRVAHLMINEKESKRRLQEGRLDLSITLNPFTESCFLSECFFKDTFSILLPESHPLYMADFLTFSDLKHLNYVALPKDFCGTRLIDVMADILGFTPYIIFEGELGMLTQVSYELKAAQVYLSKTIPYVEKHMKKPINSKNIEISVYFNILKKPEIEDSLEKILEFLYVLQRRFFMESEITSEKGFD